MTSCQPATYLGDKVDTTSVVQISHRLRVLRSNPVTGFSKKLGFSVVSEDDAHYYMERSRFSVQSPSLWSYQSVLVQREMEFSHF